MRKTWSPPIGAEIENSFYAAGAQIIQLAVEYFGRGLAVYTIGPDESPNSTR